MADRPDKTLACSVVIPSYNGRHLLETCLASIDRHRPRDLPIEVIVADDASTDGTADWLARAHPWARCIARRSNGGFCASANAGIDAATAPIVQLLNNDTEVEAGWIEAGLRPFVDPSVGSVAPLVVVRSDPSRVDSAGDEYAAVGWPSKRGHGQSASDWAARPADRVFGASGSSAFYRADLLRGVGGFDLGFGSYYEDVDLAFRLRWAGFDCAYAPDCRIRHDVSASYDHTRPDLQRRMSRNAEVLFWSNLSAGWLAVAALPHLGFLAAQGVHRLLRGRFRPFWDGKVDAWRDRGSLPARRRVRADLAAAATRRPRFCLKVVSSRNLLNHRKRPGESTGSRRPEVGHAGGSLGPVGTPLDEASYWP